MAVEIGKVNKLKVLREVSIGVYLDGDTIGDVLLPKRYVPEGTKEGDEVEVFIHLDSEDRLIATTERPLAQVGEFAWLKVVSVSKFGAFLDWGLMKDLLVPFREQKEKMEKDRYYAVYVYFDDETGRIVASAKVDRFLDNVSPDYNPGEEVKLFIVGRTELGYKAVINGLHSGLLYYNQVFKSLQLGQQTKGYIARVREDEKIDLLLERPGYEKVDELSQKLLDALQKAGGFLPLTDKSVPADIEQRLGMSKKTFKKAIGALYKQRLIELLPDGIKQL
ncbi:CvfB family protein [Geofilum rhodophaeum]|uniref:CvfB family protein n=1 Tax=Geofilum rhodophaeum TaxID=1965019 RepID=UPI000B5242C6|nr:S1-like domain-containing RNA-binding protein [Geofilum rhodophaeum]